MDATDLWLSLGIYSLKFHEARDITEALPSGRLSARNQNIMVKWQTQLCHHEFLSIKHWRSDFWSCEMVTWRVIPITHKSSNYLFFCLKTRRHQEETSQWPFAGKICLLSRDITLPTKVRLVKAMVFQWSCMDVRVGLWRRLSTKEFMLLNCGENSWESLGLQGDPTSPS